MHANKQLIGNLIIYIAEKCRPLYHTNLLKILYLIDEESTRRTGAPLTWLQYNVWQLGPVPEDLYYAKIEGHNKFSEFIEFKQIGENSYMINPVAKLDISHLSPLDLEIANHIISTYGHKRAVELVNITHAEGSLWHNAVKRSDIHFSHTNKTSNIPVDFTELIKDDDFKKSIYYATLENIELETTLH